MYLSSVCMYCSDVCTPAWTTGVHPFDTIGNVEKWTKVHDEGVFYTYTSGFNHLNCYTTIHSELTTGKPWDGAGWGRVLGNIFTVDTCRHMTCKSETHFSAYALCAIRNAHCPFPWVCVYQCSHHRLVMTVSKDELMESHLFGNAAIWLTIRCPSV